MINKTRLVPQPVALLPWGHNILLIERIRDQTERFWYAEQVQIQGYLAYSLSLRNLEKMRAERGVHVDHATLYRWVLRLTPLLNQAFRRHKRQVGQH
ncbi:hypothetical protein XBI1_3010014 [Xenorhabdus bovienii str. Intermedium]|uniref:Uncharacterized protein n=1 Tax=Xenorhabdus bovienii str. Intermedium TaxID=1379677 RepID=A0A077QLL4_XENBV|nr:hypothetical protein XBI1_3010014 [Xenorhabdus bovienii str. Intermedium]